MNKGDLISKVAQENNMSKADAKRMVNNILNTISTALVDGDSRVSLADFGIFTVVTRPAREGRNPKTGEVIQIKERKAVKFKPSTKLLEKF
ncbi:DNA-binding protein HU-beta [Desulfolithobacter dissulfuricans]|uniref:DNA-binding protein HU-beta n=1 Tax=Desulfolithobacter dissulfuricans TaxID=2795293 RepID=A0A915XI18_9BACT|nr:HU family DNA-binding protein [Desulfolithobacter dissulfuricans]BCO09319.1 DNA-binding protein HU-beta [Desulfolithobacter dissulfuricans]